MNPEDAPAQEQPPIDPLIESINRGIKRLVYHKRLLELVNAASQFASALDGVVAAAQDADPENVSAQPEEDAAVQAVQEILRATVARAPGMAAVFHVAAGGRSGAIPE